MVPKSKNIREDLQASSPVTNLELSLSLQITAISRQSCKVSAGCLEEGKGSRYREPASPNLSPGIPFNVGVRVRLVVKAPTSAHPLRVT
jgi:hypothetical protein